MQTLGRCMIRARQTARFEVICIVSEYIAFLVAAVYTRIINELAPRVHSAMQMNVIP